MGASSGAATSALTALLQAVLNGLTVGSLYSLIALGYSMVYGVLGMLNFAHGDVFMVGAYIGWGLAALLAAGAAAGGVGGAGAGGLGLLAGPALLALMLVAAAVGSGFLGLAIERFAYRPLRRSSRLAPLISALGVSIILENAVMLIFGTRAKVYPAGAALNLSWSLSLGGVVLSGPRLLMLVASLVLMIGLEWLVRKTPMGRAMRATAEDREAAAFCGLDPDRVVATVFFLGSALAGAGWVLVGVYYTQVDFFMGFGAGMKAFTAAVLGGIGDLRGAAIGGLVLGVIESLAVAFISPVYRDVITFSALILVLLVKPGGLFGRVATTRA